MDPACLSGCPLARIALAAMWPSLREALEAGDPDADTEVKELAGLLRG